MKAVFNFIGSLYRDFIVYISKDFVEYFVKGECITYKSRIPFNITIGKYRFLKGEDFIRELNNVKY